MATFAFDPEDYTLGDTEADLPITSPGTWDVIEIREDSNGDKYLYLERSSSDFEHIVFDDVPSDAVDVEMYMDSYEEGSGTRGRAITRATDPYADAYRLGHDWDEYAAITRRKGGTTTELAVDTSSDVPGPRRLAIRARTWGTDPVDLKLKAWDDASEFADMASLEPSSWLLETTDPNADAIVAGGRIGMLFAGAGGAGTTHRRRVYFVGFGTARDPAPTAATSAETRTLTAAIASVSAATLTPALTPQTRPLGAAVATASAATLSVARTPQTRSLTAAVAPASAATLTPARTSQTRTLSPAVASVSAATLQVVEGVPGPETRTIAPAVAPVSAATLTARPTPQARTLTAAIAPATAAVLAVQRTPQTRSLTTAIATAHAATLAVDDSSRGRLAIFRAGVRERYGMRTGIRARYAMHAGVRETYDMRIGVREVVR